MADATEEIKRAISQGFRDSQMALTRHTTDILGSELSQFTDDVKKFTGSAFNIAATTAKSAFGLAGDTEDLDEDRNKMLENIDDNLKEPKAPGKLLTYLSDLKVGLVSAYTGQSEEVVKANMESKKILEDIYQNQVEAELARARETKGKDPKKSPWMMLLFAVGVIVGAVAGAILFPFKLLYTALTKIKPIAKLFEKIGGFFAKIKGAKIFGYLDNFAKFLVNKVPMLGKILRGFKYGFTKLAWPLTILFGIIDFFKGFFGTEGTFIEKIKAGLWSVIEGFIELPVKLFGWIADWFLGLFDIEVEGGTAAKMMGFIKKGFDFIFDFFKAYYELVWIWIAKPIIGWFKPKLEELKEGLKIFWGQLQQAWDELQGPLEKVKLFGHDLLMWIGEILSAIWDRITYPFKRAKQLIEELISIGESDKSFSEKIKEVFKSILGAFLDNIFNMLPWFPGKDAAKKWINEKTGLGTTGEAPADDKENIDRETRNERSKKERQEKEKAEQDRKRIEQLIEEARAGNKEAAMALQAAGIAFEGKGRTEREMPPDETDNQVLGFAMMGMM